MCTIALAKVQRNYNCYNVYFYECLLLNVGFLLLSCVPAVASGIAERSCEEKEAKKYSPLQGHIFYNSPAPLFACKRGYLPLSKPLPTW